MATGHLPRQVSPIPYVYRREMFSLFCLVGVAAGLCVTFRFLPMPWGGAAGVV